MFIVICFRYKGTTGDLFRYGEYGTITDQTTHCFIKVQQARLKISQNSVCTRKYEYMLYLSIHH